MPRKDPKGDVRHDSNGRGDAAHRPTDPGHNHPGGGALEAVSVPLDRSEGIAALSYLCLRTDGWLRVVPDESGKTLFIKWKFTRGRWGGRYIMAVVMPWAWDHGFALLQSKLIEVDEGKRVPVQDSFYQNG
jgi:hypothetical protein